VDAPLGFSQFHVGLTLIPNGQWVEIRFGHRDQRR